ncbi:MAG: TIGR03435 family protein [Ignavibacteriota bacterium]
MVLFAASLSIPVRGQSSDVFDAVAITPRPYEERVSIRFDVNPKFLRARANTLRDLITKAYGMEIFQLAGIADWMTTERYDLEATSGDEVDRTRMMAMLRDLLAKRFRLVAHHEMRETPVFALVVDTGGPKLPALGSGDELKRYQQSGNQATMPIGSTIQDLIRVLNSKTGDGALSRLAIDRTGLQGLYRIQLTYDVEPDPNWKGLQLFKIDFPSALKSLGLRLEATRASVDFLVIDSAAKPKFDK